MFTFIRDNSIVLVSSVLLVGLVGGASALEKAKEEKATATPLTEATSTKDIISTTPASTDINSTPTGKNQETNSNTDVVAPSATPKADVTTPAPTPTPTITTKPSIKGVRGEEDDD